MAKNIKATASTKKVATAVQRPDSDPTETERRLAQALKKIEEQKATIHDLQSQLHTQSRQLHRVLKSSADVEISASYMTKKNAAMTSGIKDLCRKLAEETLQRENADDARDEIANERDQLRRELDAMRLLYGRVTRAQDQLAGRVVDKTPEQYTSAKTLREEKRAYLRAWVEGSGAEVPPVLEAPIAIQAHQRTRSGR